MLSQRVHTAFTPCSHRVQIGTGTVNSEREHVFVHMRTALQNGTGRWAWARGVLSEGFQYKRRSVGGRYGPETSLQSFTRTALTTPYQSVSGRPPEILPEPDHEQPLLTIAGAATWRVLRRGGRSDAAGAPTLANTEEAHEPRRSSRMQKKKLTNTEEAHE